MKFIIVFFSVYFLVGSVEHHYRTKLKRLSMALTDAHVALLSCASNQGFILYLDQEQLDVDCVRAPSWHEYSVANRYVLRQTHKWNTERQRALEYLRNSKPPQMGRLGLSKSSQSK